MSDPRTSVKAATAAALWALSNGTCYAPGCPFPVVYEVRPGVYRKNAQIAHIHGVKPGAARFKASLSAQQRESFANLLLLCLPHHGEVDDKTNGSKLYPPNLLQKWKADREGKNEAVLANLRVQNEEALFDTLTRLFEPPIKKLEKIADQLERTGNLNAESLVELQQVLHVLRVDPVGVDAQSARSLAFAAEILGSLDLKQTASTLMQAAETMQYSRRFGIE